MSMHQQNAEHEVVEENCPRCGEATPHEVDVTLEQETDGDVAAENEKYARRPYRVSVCLECGSTDNRRMV